MISIHVCGIGIGVGAGRVIIRYYVGVMVEILHHLSSGFQFLIDGVLAGFLMIGVCQAFSIFAVVKSLVYIESLDVLSIFGEIAYIE